MNKIAATARRHFRRDCTYRVNMRHHVDVPIQLPFFVGRVFISHACDAGVGAENIDRPQFLLDPRDEVLNLTLVRDIAGNGDAIHTRRHVAQ